jgi:NitT/TauT family transport system substrate-binding protein
MVFSRRQILYSGVGLAALWARPQPETSLQKSVTLVTNWYAQAEQGGFYQALATGIYRRYGLDVSIKMGGTGVNILQLLAGGAADFAIGSSFDVFAALASGIPLVTVAAIFQYSPQCLLAHPDTGVASLADLQGRPIFVSPGANLTYWPFLRARYGFRDEQKRPYTGSLAPFLLDPMSAQQGYVTSEPFRIRQEAGFDPVILPLSDYGYTPYTETIETTQRLVQTQPQLVQAFVAASLEGWAGYLIDPEPGNHLIKKENPQMTDELLSFGWQKIQEYQFIDSSGILGKMTRERWQDLFQQSVDVGLFKEDLPYEQAFTLQFISIL